MMVKFSTFWLKYIVQVICILYEKHLSTLRKHLLTKILPDLPKGKQNNWRKVFHFMHLLWNGILALCVFTFLCDSFIFFLRTLSKLRLSPILSGFVVQDIKRTWMSSQMDRKFISADLQQENMQDRVAGSILVNSNGEAGTETVTLERQP